MQKRKHNRNQLAECTAVIKQDKCHKRKGQDYDTKKALAGLIQTLRRSHGDCDQHEDINKATEEVKEKWLGQKWMRASARYFVTYFTEEAEIGLRADPALSHLLDTTEWLEFKTLWLAYRETSESETRGARLPTLPQHQQTALIRSRKIRSFPWVVSGAELLALFTESVHKANSEKQPPTP